MRNCVKIILNDGTVVYAAGYVDRVAREINEARGSGKLLQLERETIPTGQMFWVDPDAVALVAAG